MNLPETFAGGRFDLPLKVAKIVRLADSSEAERPNANRKLEQCGLFVDRLGIVWSLKSIPTYARDKAS